MSTVCWIFLAAFFVDAEDDHSYRDKHEEYNDKDLSPAHPAFALATNLLARGSRVDVLILIIEK